jgi:acyl transferase domain-containing protein/NADPH:quinone reductase-like Zn-dependent oxidoreductase/NAD(P)-dependent dehydrogenase (short-subunit alcohol dehydrogenase family)/SAM-dependent methyltransferase/acyl carrier protein
MRADNQPLSPEKQTLLALRALRRRVEELERAQEDGQSREASASEPIAIVGMACRLPGDVGDPEQYWQILSDKRNAVIEIPQERLDLSEIYDSRPQVPGKTYSRWAGMLRTAGDFDAEFFGISPREALSTDPQQRMLLEASWEALEDACIDPRNLIGEDVGVFVGISNSEYSQHHQQSVPIEEFSAYMMQGSALNTAAGRLSYFYGFSGPSLAIDTACSSSLVAIDRACRSLVQNETTMAIAAGVSFLANPEMFVIASQWGMLSLRGECRSFDFGADGFVRGEGCGVVVLKRLREAELSGDRILGVILGSAVNQDGASSGLTVPNGQAQQELLRRAHKNAGVEAWQVGYVEAHGTGTSLGDPIEAEALGMVFGAGRKRERPLLIGSVKTNLGHLEAAAGIAGLIKVVLGLQHGEVPAQLHWTGPSEHVRWSDLPLEVVTEARAWEPIDGRRIGGVSSFGFSGTNAHVVVESRLEPAAKSAGAEVARDVEVLVISARTAAALRALALRYAKYLETSDCSWAEICYTAGTGRGVFAERLALVASEKVEALQQLRGWLEDGDVSPVVHHRVRAGERVRVGLVASDPAVRDGWHKKLADLGVAAVVIDGRGRVDSELQAAGVTLVVVVDGSDEIKPSAACIRAVHGGQEQTFAKVVAELFVYGATVDWKAWYGGRSLRRVSLPTYAFQRERYWIAASKHRPQVSSAAVSGKLLGYRLRAAGVRAQYETELSLEGETDWIGSHLVGDRAILPATGHLELMLEAGREVLGGGESVRLHVEDVALHVPLAIERGQARAVQTVVEAEAGGRSRVRIYAEDAAGQDGWQAVSEGWLRAMAMDASVPVETIDLGSIRERLRSESDIAGFYDRLGRRDIHLEGVFRGLRQLWTGPEEALGEIVATADEAGYAIAPWRLDACLQVAGAVVADAGEEGATYLPSSIDEFTVYATPKDRCWSHVRTRRIDTNTIAADLSVTDNNGNLIISCSSIRFKKTIAKVRTRDVSSWMYRPSWRPQTLESVAKTTAIQETVQALNLQVSGLLSDPMIEQYDEFFRELEVLSSEYVLSAFQTLGWPDKGDVFSIEELRLRWNILSQHRQLFARLIDIASEVGGIHATERGIIFQPIPAIDTGAKLNELKDRYPFGEAELEMVGRCGSSLAEVLIGNRDGRELVFPGGSSQSAERLYRESVPARIYNQMLAQVVTRILLAKGTGTARILEVGGGTGSTTHHVIESMRAASVRPEEYLFTDISSLLVRRAREAFAAELFVQTKVFDLEHSAEAQGIEGTFDIVLAVNVVHATSSIQATIDRLKKLLSPDGELILIEVTGKQRWADITVGLLDGWWCFQDLSLRSDYPALASGEWKTLLERLGFARVAVLPSDVVKQTPNTHSIFDRQELILAGEPSFARRVLLIGDLDQIRPAAIELEKRGALISNTSVERLESALHESAPFEAVLCFAPMNDQSRIGAGDVTEQAGRSLRDLLAVVRLLRAVRKRPDCKMLRLYVVTRVSGIKTGLCESEIHLLQSPILGMAAAVALEVPELRCTSIDISEIDSNMDEPSLSYAQIADEVMANTDEMRIQLRAGQRFVSRLERMQSVASPDLQERTQLALRREASSSGPTAKGIEALAYEPAASRELAADEIEIAVRATALNFRDVLKATGLLDHSGLLGTDCAGIITRLGSSVKDFNIGDEVVGIAPGCFATHVVTSEALTAHKPSSLSFANAAGQVVAYLTADYCLNEVAHIRKGQRVLIHAAAGGVGLSAVHLARRVGAEVWVTAGSERKRDFLRSLGIEHVYDSRNLDFQQQIPNGIEVVLNSLTGPAIDAGLTLLNPGGIFIELGKTDIRDPETVRQNWPEVRYIAADLTPLFAAGAPWVRERLASVMEDLAKGNLTPLPVMSFATSEVKQAFRYMAAAKHIGRIVVRSNDNAFADGAHVITGGLRGIGLQLTEWLVRQGARDLVLVGRSAPTSEAVEVIERLETEGIRVRVLQGDIADYETAKRVVNIAGPGLQGFWHCAGVLDNATLDELTWERFAYVMQAKVDGAWNLHELTRERKLEFFVLFSSWASLAGSRAQANHCSANAFLDGLAHLRVAQGLSGLSINWGAWGEIGAAASERFQRQLLRSGMEPMDSVDAFAALGRVLAAGQSQVGVASIDWQRYLNSTAGSSTTKTKPNPFYSEFVVLDQTKHQSSVKQGERSSTVNSAASSRLHSGTTLTELRTLTPDARKVAIQRTIEDLIRKTLDLKSGEELDPDEPLSDLGMDSLLAIELRNSLATLFATRFPSSLLFDYPTLRLLTRFIDQEIFSPLNADDHPKPAHAGDVLISGNSEFLSQDPLSILDEIEQLSDDEVDSLLGKGQSS